MPDTRDLFERIVADRPPSILDVASLVARGDRATRRRRSRYAAIVVASVAVVSVVTVQTTGPASPQLGGGADVPGVTGFAFSSHTQVLASNRNVHEALVAAAGGRQNLTADDPVWNASVTNERDAIRTHITYRVPGGLRDFSVLTRRAHAAVDQSSPCDKPRRPDSKQADGSTVMYGWDVECASEALPGGAVAWTYRVHEASDTLPLQDPAAIVVGVDGSTLYVESHGETVNQGVNPAAAPSPAEVMALAVALANAWQKGAPAVQAQSANSPAPLATTQVQPSGQPGSRPTSSTSPPASSTPSAKPRA